MRPGRIIFSTVILLGLLAGTAVPVARAQGTPAITFHVYNTHEITAPADAEGTIVVDGTIITAESGFGAFMVENICEGTGCTSQDIYFKIELALSWASDWGHDYPTWNVAPMPKYYFGGTEAYLDQVDLGYCGGPTGETGTCTYNFEGTIPASEISEDPDDPHEMFMLAYNANYGGLDITAAYTITISTSPILEVQAPCSGQYNIGASLGTITLQANDPTARIFGLYGPTTPAIGDYFVIQVSGAWKNNGVGPDLRKVGMRYGVNNSWFELDDSSAECKDMDTYYLQNNGSIYFRVYDTDGNFASNTGSLTLTFYGVTARTRYKSGCELNYEVGDLIEQKTVDASWPNGTPLATNWYKPWNPNAVGGDSGGEDKLYTRYYMLETIGGPARVYPSLYTYNADLGVRNSNTNKVPDAWYDTYTDTDIIKCRVSTDMIGHIKIFFAMDQQISKTEFQQFYYGFRVRDNSTYTDNSGTLGYRLYQATYMQMTTPGVAPDADGCALYSHEATAEATITIQGNSSSGSVVPTLTHNALYAFEVVNGPWKDNGVNNYTVEISPDNGNTWTDIDDYANLLCASSADGNHTMIYLYASAGQIWRARANDGDSNFANNSQSIGMKVYAGLTSINLFPKCEDDYNLSKNTLSDEQRKIPGNDAAGKELSGSLLGAKGPLIPGSTYAIEITDEGKWYEAGTGPGSYLVDISDDGGATWKHLEDYSVLCATQLGDGTRYKIYFTATSSNYNLRVRDGDGNFLNNSGNVFYNLYLGTNIVNPPTTGPGSSPPPEWVVACNESYSRPDSFISWLNVSIAGFGASFPVPRVGDWIEYLKNAITFYFAWCPQHTEALRSTGDVYMDREPFASIQSYIDFIKNMQTILEGYRAVGGDELPTGLTSQEPDLFSDTQYIDMAGGSDSYKVPSAAGPWDIFTIGGVDTETSVWFGGKLDLTKSIGQTNMSSMNAYKAACVEEITPLFGIVATQSCSILSLLRYSKIVTWVLLLIDIIAVLWFFLVYDINYIKKWIKTLESI